MSARGETSAKTYPETRKDRWVYVAHPKEPERQKALIVDPSLGEPCGILCSGKIKNAAQREHTGINQEASPQGLIISDGTSSPPIWEEAALIIACPG